MKRKYLDASGYPDHGFDKNMRARLVFDGVNLFIPKEIAPEKDGVPIDEDAFNAFIESKQVLQGTDKEATCEVGGRICYDSLNQPKMRSSPKYWEHIREVAHGSVIEHAHYTFRMPFSTQCLTRDAAPVLATFMNRKGVWFEYGGSGAEITLNLRAVLEWDYWTRRKACHRPNGRDGLSDIADCVGEGLYEACRAFAPFMLPEKELRFAASLKSLEIEPIEPHGPNEKVISIFQSGSRGFSHEQVRHREEMSQKSTRFCDEDGSDYVQHPLVTAYLREEIQYESSGPMGESQATDISMRQLDAGRKIDASVSKDRETYAVLVKELQEYVKRKNPGIDALTARKQARGAARGYLGNGLYTEILFTASVNSWREIVKKRASDAADAEIRNVTAQTLYALQSSAAGHYFDDFKLQAAKDGLGLVVVGAAK